ncbi:hypothetical protein FLP41_03055 (plasmid) [Paracoccus marcusii]|uniref:hypothetical protein n=1 Tax=Paracoccus marcusii TaxID=59779 RepID=UPI002ED469C1|nr:hypothetical protein FLP41_03055 [Paracoccus marcusii]
MAEGTAGLRCETCFAAEEAAIAARRGWTRIGPDPERNPNYHLYRHACGAERRIARANLFWGRSTARAAARAGARGRAASTCWTCAMGIGTS